MSNPTPVLIETYKGIDLYQDVEAQIFFFYYQGQLYTNFNSQFTAEAQIGILLAGATEPQNLEDFMPPTAETRSPIAYYKGVPVFEFEWGYMGGGTGYESWFYWKGNKQSVMADHLHLYPLIDDLLILKVKEEETPVIPPVVPPVVEPPVVAPSGFSWLWGWIENIKAWFGGIGTAITGSINSLGSSITGIGTALSSGLSFIGSSISGIGTAIGGIGQSITQAIFGGLQQTTDQSKEPLQNAMSSALEEALTATSAHSPDPEIQAKLEALIKQMQERQKEIIENIQHSPIDPQGAQAASNALIVQLLGAQVGIKTAALLIDVLHPIKSLEVLQAVSPMVDALFSGVTVPQLLNLPIEASIIPALRKYVNSIYTPEIPGYGDLINMLVKEKITREEFALYFSYKGYSEDWSNKIWDAHFSAPNLNDILTTWRRGKISEDDVDKLMILVDLDPAYKQIFDTRKYVDPSLSIARYMFEIGSINEDQVRDIIHRNGYNEEDTNRLVNFTVHYQERRYRQRYITALATGYARGTVQKDELNKSVLDAGYTQGTADWIVKSADIRKDIASRIGVSKGPKLLAIGDLKKAYANDIISVDQLRLELGVRQYESSEVETLIKVMDIDREDVVHGKRVVALSIGDMKAAWNQGVWTDDKLLMELQLRGLSLDECQVLLDTLKAKKGMSELQA